MDISKTCSLLMGLNGLDLGMGTMGAAEVHVESGLLFFLDICFDVSVDVDLDDYRLCSENIVKQCLLSAPLFCST